MRRIVLLGLLALLAGCRKVRSPEEALAAGDAVVLRGLGFATPESVLHDPLSDVYYVSNINGGPLAADDNGFISAVSPQGKLLQLKWIDGAADSVTLNAPKGMALDGKLLYVADINVIRKFDRRTGAPRGEVAIAGAGFLNDLVMGYDGSLYITDSGLREGAGGLEAAGTDAIYRLSPEGKLDTLARGEALGHPNGIALSGDTVWVVSYGSGELYRLEAGRKTAAVKLPQSGLDGLVVFNGTAFVSSWEAQAVLRGPLSGPFTEVVGGLRDPADLGHDLWRHRLLLPLFHDNEIWIIPLVAF
jgi:DNA-binding beta-propeller fold protein YncE